MIEGVVNDAREAVIALLLQGPAGQAREVDAVVDTGYSGHLALPPVLVAEMEFPFAGTGWAFLANAEEVNFAVHNVTVLWDGQPRYIEASALGDTPLVGMALLLDHNLSIDVESGGSVVIQARR